MTFAEPEMYSDFYQKISENIIDFKVEPNDELIRSIIANVDSNIEYLYKQWGSNDTEFRDELYVFVRDYLTNIGELK